MTLALMTFLGGTGVWAQSHSGAPYGARDPHVCGSTKDPVKGAPTAEQAKGYFLCGMTGERQVGGYLYLESDVKIEVAASSRPYNSWTDSTPDIDPKQPVYSIRGAFSAYQCMLPGSGGGDSYPIGKNCNRTDAGGGVPLRATGICYKDAFADWHCFMHATDAAKETPGQPAPAK
jgi:hypothetical protein